VWQPFDETYEKLKIWIDNNKRLPSQMSKNQEEKKLGQWCAGRKNDKKNNKLDREKIKKLENIDCWYWSSENLFDGTYEKLKTWVNSNKRLPSTIGKNQEEKKLGQWCASKKKDKKNNKLDEEKIKKLEELDGWYWEKCTKILKIM